MVTRTGCVSSLWFVPPSLRSRRLEVVGTRKNGRPNVSLARARSLFRPLLPSACYAGYVPPCSPNRDPVHFEFVSYSSFLSIHFGTEITNTFIHSLSSIENDTRFQTKMDKMQTRFQTKKAEKIYISFGAAHTYMAYIGELPPGTFTVEELQIRMLSSTLMTYHSVFVYYATHILYTSTFKVKLLIL